MPFLTQKLISRVQVVHQSLLLWVSVFAIHWLHHPKLSDLLGVSKSVLISGDHILIVILPYFFEASLQFVFEVVSGQGGLNVGTIEVGIMSGGGRFAGTLKVASGEVRVFETQIPGGWPSCFYIRLRIISLIDRRYTEMSFPI